MVLHYHETFLPFVPSKFEERSFSANTPTLVLFKISRNAEKFHRSKIHNQQIHTCDLVRGHKWANVCSVKVQPFWLALWHFDTLQTLIFDLEGTPYIMAPRFSPPSQQPSTIHQDILHPPPTPPTPQQSKMLLSWQLLLYTGQDCQHKKVPLFTSPSWQCGISPWWWYIHDVWYWYSSSS